MKDETLTTPAWIPTVRRLIGVLVPLLYFPLMLRLLGQEDYGLHSMADSVAEFLMLLTFCLGAAFARRLAAGHESADPEGERRYFGLYVKTCAAAGLLILAAGLFVSLRVTGSISSLGEEEREMLKKICLLMTVDAAVFLPFGAWQALIGACGRDGFLQAVGLAVAVVTPCANLAVLFLGWASIGLVSVSIAVNLIVGAAYVLYARKRLGVSPAFAGAGPGHLRQALRSSVLPFLDLCAELLFVPADRLIVGCVLGSLMAAVYNVGAVVSLCLAALCAAAGNRLSPCPEAEELRAMPEKARSALFIRRGRRQFIVLFLFLSLLAVFGRPFLRLWAGEAYAPSWGVALLTFAALALPLLQHTGTELLHALERHRFHIAVLLCPAAVSVLLTLWLVRPWGVLGAAAATFAAHAAGAAAMNVYWHRSLGLDVPSFWKRIGRMCPAPLILAVAAWFGVNALPDMGWPLLLALAAVYAALYLLLAWRFMMNAREREGAAALLRGAWARVTGRAK